LRYLRYANSVLRGNRGLLALLLFMAMFRTAVADWSYVPSGSMEPTLFAGDYLWVDKTRYGPTLPLLNTRLVSWNQPERGDVVTFIPPHRDQLFVKRVIAVPGDRVRLDGRDIFVNDQKLSVEYQPGSAWPLSAEERIGERTHLVQFGSDPRRPVSRDEFIVPQRRYFVLGDNRDNSADSRFWGFVEEDRIMGRVTRVGWSFSERRPLRERLAHRIR